MRPGAVVCASAFCVGLAIGASLFERRDCADYAYSVNDSAVSCLVRAGETDCSSKATATLAIAEGTIMNLRVSTYPRQCLYFAGRLVP